MEARWTFLLETYTKIPGYFIRWEPMGILAMISSFLHVCRSCRISSSHTTISIVYHQHHTILLLLLSSVVAANSPNPTITTSPPAANPTTQHNSPTVPQFHSPTILTRSYSQRVMILLAQPILPRSLCTYQAIPITERMWILHLLRCMIFIIEI